MNQGKGLQGGPQAYILLGPEAGKKQDKIDEIRKTLSAPGVPLEETVFYAGETPAAEITQIVQNHSLFAQSRLFIIKNAEEISKEKDIALIASCIKTLEADTALLLVSDEIRLAPSLDNLCPKENRMVFYELFENEKNKWVTSFFSRGGYKIEPDGVDTILEMVENSTDILKNECSRIMFFLPKDRPVTAQDIEQWLSHNREESVYTLFSRIAAGDKTKSIESLHTLLGAKEKAQSILAGLGRCFYRLRDYIALAPAGGVPAFPELKKIGITSPKAKDDYLTAARRYNYETAGACITLTAEYEILTRAEAVFESVLMDVYVLKLMGMGH
jgi:DNA polymerase-3 subunit delta